MASADRFRRDGPSLRTTFGRGEGERCARIGLVRETDPRSGSRAAVPAHRCSGIRHPVLPCGTGKIHIAARTRENFGPLSQTAAGFGKLAGRSATGVPVVSRAGMRCARPLGARGELCGGKTRRGLGGSGEKLRRRPVASRAAMSSQRRRARPAAPSPLAGRACRTPR
jgi:hypothetical protein